MAKVSIIGAGMLGQPGVAAQMFDILSQEGINIEIISTSEISISCLVAEDRVKDAVRVIHNGLLLESKEVNLFMDSLRSFMDEMLNDQGRKEGFISDLH